ncbi:MAG: UDP-N-acetylmuramate dehydrogenase [Lachnospiraceae bacterium]|nr:UDP-N-acetylmuramate dehydrogenase [Lachnospiraceae bacterium]
MKVKEFYNQLIHIIDETKVKLDESMANHTTFRIGGNADIFVTPTNIEEIKEIITLCQEQEMPFYIVGNGSNLLVGDKGYRGLIIQIYSEMNQIIVEDDYIKAEAGALLSKIASKALANSLTGFEFASGIPGTLGGAVFMNAGAYGGEMKDILYNVTALTPDGTIMVIPKEELELGYRTSVVSKRKYIVLSAMIKLQQGEKQKISDRMEELKEQRTTKQPLEFPSAGSTFKRPVGHFTGKLIQEAGLCGFQVGGAAISEKHCGFVINKDHATAKDVVVLMQQVSEKIEEQFGVILEPEIKKLGEF